MRTYDSRVINAPIFINLFFDRLEIVSPGTLPNTLTKENIRYGVHIERNPTILSMLERDKDFRYSGRGSGIPRVIKKCKEKNLDVCFINEKTLQLFKVVFTRPESVRQRYEDINI